MLQVRSQKSRGTKSPPLTCWSILFWYMCVSGLQAHSAALHRVIYHPTPQVVLLRAAVNLFSSPAWICGWGCPYPGVGHCTWPVELHKVPMDPPLQLVKVPLDGISFFWYSAMVALRWTNCREGKSLWLVRETKLGDAALFVYKKAFYPGISQLNVLVTYSSEVLCRGEHESRWNGGSPGFPWGWCDPIYDFL